jgi:hypothetical protein
VQDAVIAEPAAAALFPAVHDVLRSPAALHTVLAALRPGAWVGAIGGNGRPPGSPRSPLWSPPCTPRSSGTSPASTARGGTSLSWSMTCGSPRSPSVPATWPWAAPLTMRRGLVRRRRTPRRPGAGATGRSAAPR